MPAFGQRLESVVQSMEAVDDGHRFRLAYLRKQWDTQKHNVETFALKAVRERYLRPRTENLGSPEFTELLELYHDRVHDASVASAAKTSVRQRFGGSHRRGECDWDGVSGNRDKFIKTARLTREALAPRPSPAKDTTKDAGTGKTKAEASVADNAE
eukprot:jgi/Tetstr1/430276/TSEL_020104.t1